LIAVQWQHPDGGRFHAEVPMSATGTSATPESAVQLLAEALKGIEERDALAAWIDWSRLDAMPARQREVVKRLVHGERVDSIAAAMFLSRSTVRNHLSAAFRQCGVHTQGELVRLFMRPAYQPVKLSA